MSIKFVPYVVMEGGRTLEAVAFYREIFQAEIVMLQKASDIPGFTSEQLKDYVLHAHLQLPDGAELYLCDSFPQTPYKQGNNVTICINTEDTEITRGLFNTLLDGGTVRHPLEETFFSPAFGTVVDKFGVTFTISTISTKN
ncbi:VOC family protein [Paenibacillus sp. strain BS8-2]